VLIDKADGESRGKVNVLFWLAKISDPKISPTMQAKATSS